MDGDIWFPVSYDNPADAMQVQAAVSICHQCPVREQCLTEALADEAGRKLYARYGIRGGYTPQGRYNHYRRSVHNRPRVAA
jgi:hypothetical protein